MITRRKIKGFTLVEMLVSLAVFMTASLVIMDIFLVSNRGQRRSSVMQKIQSDARIAMANISESVRSGTVDYGYYSSLTNPVQVLALKDQDNKPVSFRLGTSGCTSSQSTPCLQVSRDGGTSWNNMTSSDVKVTFLDFYISPLTDPFGTGTPPNVQPRVTIAMGLQSISPAASDQSPISLQTTVSSRVYKR